MHLIQKSLKNQRQPQQKAGANVSIILGHFQKCLTVLVQSFLVNIASLYYTCGVWNFVSYYFSTFFIQTQLHRFHFPTP